MQGLGKDSYINRNSINNFRRIVFLYDENRYGCPKLSATNMIKF